MAKRDNGQYTEAQVLGSIAGTMENLNSALLAGGPMPMQQGRWYPGGMRVDGRAACDCAINPTHCFRTVSQRSLSVPVRFLSELPGTPNLAAGSDLFDLLFTSANGAVGDLTPAAGPGLIFNDANVTPDRQRIYDLVLIAIRTEITVLLDDAQVVGAGSINVSTVQSRLEELANQYLELKVYHSADRNDPWIDRTNLGYFQRPRGQYQLVPPVMWIDRDPAMEMVLAAAEFGGGQGHAPVFEFPTRDLQGTASVTVESLFVPDPYSCPDLWPGEICPRDLIGNTPDYKGRIISAVRKLTRS